MSLFIIVPSMSNEYIYKIGKTCRSDLALKELNYFRKKCVDSF